MTLGGCYKVFEVKKPCVSCLRRKARRGMKGRDSGMGCVSVKTRETKQSFVENLSGFCNKYIPSSFSMVLLITVISVVMALFLTDSTPMSIGQNWYDGFWSMLTFSFQICMLMFTGFLVGDSKPVKKLMQKIAKAPKSATQAMLFYWLIVGFLGYLHFAVSMAAAMLLGRALIVEQDKKGNKMPYHFMVALGYCALILQAGPTAGSPLVMASKDNFMADVVGVIPLTKSMLTMPVILMNLCIYVTVCVLIMFLMSRLRDTISEEQLSRIKKDFLTEDENVVLGENHSFAWRMDHTRVFQMSMGIIGLVICSVRMVGNFSEEFNFNAINFLFLMLALVFHGTPDSILASTGRAVKNLSGVIFQYPFYAGVFGILNYSGLGGVLTQAFVSISSKRTFTFLIFVFTALLNFLVPSGGSQYMVEAPYVMPAALQLGVPVNWVLNAFTCGDLLTNLLQPFWALPLVVAFRVKYKDVFPYSLMVFTISAVYMGLFFLCWMY